MQHVPMCGICNEYEVGAFNGHESYCSDLCADMAYDAVGASDFFTMDEADYYAQYDDDPNPYAGTYSEE